MADRLRALFGDEVFNAVVGLGSDAPVPLEIEVIELIFGDNIAAASIHDLFDDAIFDDPAFAGKSVFLETAPAGSGLAVEEQAPAGSFLAGGKLIQFGVCFLRAQ